MIWLVSPYWLNLIDIELVDLLHMFLDVVCKSVYGERQGRENEGEGGRGRETWCARASVLTDRKAGRHGTNMLHWKHITYVNINIYHVMLQYIYIYYVMLHWQASCSSGSAGTTTRSCCATSTRTSSSSSPPSAPSARPSWCNGEREIYIGTGTLRETKAERRQRHICRGRDRQKGKARKRCTPKYTHTDIRQYPNRSQHHVPGRKWMHSIYS